jgi:hypothetical protein
MSMKREIPGRHKTELPLFLYGKQSKTTPVSTGVFLFRPLNYFYYNQFFRPFFVSYPTSLSIPKNVQPGSIISFYSILLKIATYYKHIGNEP